MQLRDAGLVEAANAADPDEVDAHPLVREHFGAALRKENEAAWKEGNRRLYEWYAASTKEEPDTAEEMGPLYTAVMHGCRAGQYQEAYDQVFRKRIRRSNEGYATKKLGMWGADLAALTGFFDKSWNKPVPALRETARSFVLDEVSFDLRALGWLDDAVEPMTAGLEMWRAQKNWKNAAIAAGNLSELQLALGRLKDATEWAQQSVQLADQSGDAFQRLAMRTTLADALHQEGAEEEARRLFGEAEQMQRESQPKLPLLYSVQGYQYCDLLLAKGETDQVLQRAEQTIEVARSNNWLLSIGLDHLTLGRAHFARLAAGQPDQKVPARRNLDQAVDGLRAAGHQGYLPLGLIHRAAFDRHTHDFRSAARDLEEALRLATRGHMRLHEADTHLELARLQLAQEHQNEARAELAQAQDLVQKTGYARRAPEVAALAKQLAVK